MSTPADARAELEALAHRAAHWAPGAGLKAQIPAAVLEAADVYAAAFAVEYVNRLTPEQLRARLRLAEATAEADGKPA